MWLYGMMPVLLDVVSWKGFQENLMIQWFSVLTEWQKLCRYSMHFHAMPISGTLNGMSTRYGLFHTGNPGLAVSPGSRGWVGFWWPLVTCFFRLHYLNFQTIGHWFRTHGAIAFATSGMSLTLSLEPCHGPSGVEVYGCEWFFGASAEGLFHGVNCNEAKQHAQHRYRTSAPWMD